MKQIENCIWPNIFRLIEQNNEIAIILVRFVVNNTNHAHNRDEKSLQIFLEEKINQKLKRCRDSVYYIMLQVILMARYHFF